jgi:radical SAM protein with 4Fe4S-binding SPASM domain
VEKAAADMWFPPKMYLLKIGKEQSMHFKYKLIAKKILRDAYFNIKRIPVSSSAECPPFITKEYAARRKFELSHPPPCPPVLAVEPASICNLKCPMCPYGQGNPDKTNDRSKDLMSWDLFTKVIDRLTGITLSVGFGGNGEPLMHKKLPEMIEYTSRKGWFTRLTTNGTLLNEATARKIFKTGLNELRISADGATKNTYERLRVGASFEKLVGILERLKKIRREESSETKIILHCVLQTRNIKEYDLFHQVLDKYVDGITKTFPCTYGSTDISYCPLPMVKPYQCIMLAGTLSILANGDISICCNNHSHLSIVGNAASDDIIDIWKGSEYKRFRKLHLEGRFDEIDMCRNCLMTPISFIDALSNLP